MDAIAKALLKLLKAIYFDPSLPPQKRELATHIAVSFHAHKNGYRLMAQVSELMSGELQIYPGHRGNTETEDATKAVHRSAKALQAIVTDFNVIPTLADLEGHPIELISKVDPAIERSLKGVNRLNFHRALLAMEKKANDDLATCTKKYGYHYIFRAGLQQYYMTKTVVENVNFWRPDARGNQYRVNAQKLGYDAFESCLTLNPAEKRLLVQIMNCVPSDAYRFWDWLEKNRVAYNAMHYCIRLMDVRQSQIESRSST